MRYALAALGTAALIMFTVPAVHASPVDAAAQSLTDGQVTYAKKGGWHGGGKGWKHGWKGGRGWGHHRGWRRGPPPWAPASPGIVGLAPARQRIAITRQGTETGEGRRSMQLWPAAAASCGREVVSASAGCELALAD